MSGTTRNHETAAHAADRNAAAAAEAAAKTSAADLDAEKKAADAKAKKALEPVSRDLMVLLLATDWLVGDKSHYDVIRRAVRKLLADAGEDGEEALLRLEGRASLDDAAQMHEDIATLQAVLDAHRIAVPVGMRRRSAVVEPAAVAPVAAGPLDTQPPEAKPAPAHR